MMLALEGETMGAALKVKTVVKDIQTRIHGQNKTDVLKWLTKVNPFTNHEAARGKHEPGTGEWFLSSPEFTSWMLPGRSLWLHGSAGKTVLCSSIIESIKARLSTYPLLFYFDFGDGQKQNMVNMLYSFLAQLAVISVPPEIQELYETCALGTRHATIPRFKETLLSLANRLASDPRTTTYIVIDGLDECGDRNMLMRT